jgi:rhomboid family GlyGly-CTERM serine protease
VLERVLRLQFRDWGPAMALCLVLVGAFALGDVMTLRYERTAVLHGAYWRLATGHLVHADAAHLSWNLLGVLLVAWLFAADYRPVEWLLIMLASTVAIDLGFLAWRPELQWYVGFSGVLHGMMAAGLLAWLVRARDALTALVAILFAGKLVWEHYAGPLPFTSESIGLPVIREAHSYGASGGLLAAAALLAYRSVPRASL